jgi:HEAT repeat protein
MHSEILAKLRDSDVEMQREGAFLAAEARLEAAVPLLVGLLASPNLGVQDAADHALRKIGGRAAVEDLLPLLRSDHPPLRNLGMDLLRALGREHLDLLLPLLRDDDPDIRIFMADILGSASDAQVVKPLCDALLHDPEVNVRYQAAVSLGELARPEAAKSLNQALGDDEWVRFAVIEALMKIRDESSVNALVRALDRSSELVSSMIIDALGELGNLKAVPLLMKRLDCAAAALRNKILRAIVRILGGKCLTLLSSDERRKFLEYLLVALDDEDAEIQDAAVVGLGHVGDERATAKILGLAAQLDPDQDLERVERVVGALASIGINSQLRSALGHEDGRALIAVMALDKLGTSQSIDALVAAYGGLNRDLQRVVSAILTRIGGGDLRDFFLDVLAESKDGTILKQALAFLGAKLRCETCVESILDHLEHPYNDVKETALDAAVALGTDAVRNRFLAMAEGSAVLDRLMGVYGLGRIDARKYKQTLLRALSDESPDIRKIGLEALGAVMDDEDVPAALLRMAHDEVPEVRQALVETLGAAETEQIRAFLFEALGDEDDWVRIRAVDALARKRDVGVAPAIIPLLEDPNQVVVMKVVGALGRIGGQAAFKALLGTLSHNDPGIQAAAEQALDQMQAEHGGDV